MEEITRIIVERFDNCETCGRRFKVAKKALRLICSNCLKEEGDLIRKAEDEQHGAKERELVSFMIGATITEIDLGEGGDADSSEIEEITIKTLKGEVVAFAAGGFYGDERYIEWCRKISRDSTLSH